MFNQVLAEEKSAHFPWMSQDVSHVYQRGSHAGLNEILRFTGGKAFVATPEGRNNLDPNFPNKLQCDSKSFMHLLYLLETATGGSYEWLTGMDLKSLRTRKQLGSEADGGSKRSREGELLRFSATSINLCMFQQISVLRNWWAEVEKRHDLGLCARCLFSFSKRPTLARGFADERSPA